MRSGTELRGGKPGERHRLDRRTPAEVKIAAGGEVHTARLVDLGSNGFGMEMPRALNMGCVVWFATTLRNAGLDVNVQGRARVVHCTQTAEETFRIGLHIEELRQQSLDFGDLCSAKQTAGEMGDALAKLAKQLHDTEASSAARPAAVRSSGPKGRP